MKTTAKQAIKAAKQKYQDEYGKRPYNAHIAVMKRYGSGQYVLLICKGNSVEYYF